MPKLTGIRVAVAGTRRIEEISKIIENLGGIAKIRPAQGTVYMQNNNIEEQINRFVKAPIDWLLLTTGIGTKMLFKSAENVGSHNLFIEKMHRIKIAARGYKTVNALKDFGLIPTVKDDDGTISGLIRSMEPYPMLHRNVVIQNYGEPESKLTAWLSSKGAVYEEILPYKHVPPDPQVVDLLLTEIINSEVDCVAFTSTPQVRFLFEHASKKKLRPQLLHAFQTSVIASAVGKVTEESLRYEGVHRVITPNIERIGSMIVTIGQYFSREGV